MFDSQTGAENFENMLNNFCFHVYAQKSLFIVENVHAFLSTAAAAASFLQVNLLASCQLKLASCQQ